jgi:3-hydroxyacyl-CoA dehydrogenase
MRIRSLGIVGAGTMGSGIAALAASAGLPVVLLDIPGKNGDRDGPARNGLERANKSKPAAFMDPGSATAIAIGNTEDDLDRLAGCDLVIEAIVEQVEPKRALYSRLEQVLPPHAIVASNTSGIPMSVLVEGRTDAFRKRFLGMHFFNPPRYLHLLEIIPGPETEAAVLEAVTQFSERVLGKGIVVAKDVPGFIANRLGVYGMVLAIRLMEKHDLSIDEVDMLTGPMLARAKSATFRTADLSGIDVIGHVTRGLIESTGEDFALPAWVQDLVKSGRHGEKTGAGFYKKVGKEIQTLDWKSPVLDYTPQAKLDPPELDGGIRGIRDLPGPHGEFAREYFLRFSHYVLMTAPKIAHDIDSVDHAIAWGYAWSLGPFKQMEIVGWDFLREGFERLGLAEPDLMDRGHPFWQSAKRSAAVDPARVTIEALQRRTDPGRIVIESQSGALWNVDGVGILEFRSKMNTIGAGVMELIHRALDEVESRGMLGLVIGNDDARAFSAGADLSLVTGLIQAEDWKKLDEAARLFQGTSMRIRQAPFPVVAATFGLTLGGGCEFALHSDLVQAHAELYMGLVEVGVGIIPAGGGTKELLFRFTADLAPYADADPFEAVKRAFQLMAMGTTSTSALEARRLGLLRDRDRITMNRDLLLGDAAQRVRDLAPGYVAPLARTITAVGKEGLGNLEYGIWAMREGGQITDFEVTLAHELSYVLTGGDGPPRTVTEQDILDLEREAFLRLLGTKQTQERIEAMLKTGKVLRN